MALLRIESADDSLIDAGAGSSAARLLARAEAMGLLEGMGTISQIDLPLIGQLLRRMGAAGLTQSTIAEGAVPIDGASLASTLERANEALEQSPLPEHEWAALRRVLGDDLLTRLCAISLASLRRYVSGQRRTPDTVARRLHFLALLVADLRGAYNDYGIRRWFERPRVQLHGRAPAGVLPRDWTPETPEALELASLAAALMGSPAT